MRGYESRPYAVIGKFDSKGSKWGRTHSYCRNASGFKASTLASLWLWDLLDFLCFKLDLHLIERKKVKRVSLIEWDAWLFIVQNSLGAKFINARCQGLGRAE
ncbi:hypothetical protein Tco_0655823 [Tanacetum coccineum]|uniref:Uncharacterized protein n=1 Tax=Tanacetum coccineum TaxID=301880 RepID=A0ABQ4X720_9ASTR